MRKLIESTFMTLDGVIDNPQNWGPPYWDDEHGDYAKKLLFAADALLVTGCPSWMSRSGSSTRTSRPGTATGSPASVHTASGPSTPNRMPPS